MSPAFQPTSASGHLQVAASRPVRQATEGVPLLPGLAWLIGLPAAALGGWSRTTRREHTDAASGMLNQAGLADRGEDLLARCRRAGRPCSIVVFNFDDLAEAGRIYSEAVNTQLGHRIASRLRQVAGVRGLVARTGKTQFTVVLPGAGRDKTLRSMARAMGYPARVELDSGGDEIVLVPDTITENAAPGDDSLHQVHRELCRDLARQQQDESRRRHYLQRERERHSRPMVLAAMSDDSGTPRSTRGGERHANTVPVPLAARA